MLNNLFSDYTIRGKFIKNRIVVPAMVTNYCTDQGEATERYLAYHEAKAKGGFGLIITENYAIDPRGRGFKNVAGLWNDEQIKSHSKLPPLVHQHGATVIAQIYHCGRQTNYDAIGTAPVAPSPIPCPFGTDIPEELSITEIEILVEKFGDTALRAKKCGFDGVEIHGGHGYLITQFLSPYSNKRVDEYGGSFDNRLKFALAIIKNIRVKCGDNFIVGMRISADEMVEGGLTIEDTKSIVPYLEKAGVDLLNVSVGNYLAVDLNVASAYTKHAWFADMAKEIKEICSIPVIAVSRINDPVIANNIILSGKADFTAMGRASLADPEMPNKAKAGHLDEIRRCIGCNHGCIGSLFDQKSIHCVLNPSLGNEEECLISQTESSKKIMIIGAGPAGLEAAISLKKSGHDVSVYEKETHGGGQFYLAAIPPSKGEISDFVRWQINQCNKLGIPINYNTEISIDSLRALVPDIVVVATGANPVRPPIKGADKKHVVFANDILAGKVLAGKNCVVIGGGQVGAETAHYLSQQLRNVSILEMGKEIASGEAVGPKWQLIKALEARKVAMHTEVNVKEITDNEVISSDGVSYLADTVVLATGSRPNNELYAKLIDENIESYIIGDAKKIRTVYEATTEGYNIGRQICNSAI